ncbi:hypothetical protein KIF59_00880 [Enterobacter cloacae subsp. cloacae]|nr:hypothetical protein [Enterobacter cloacae subsp. cloacae]
MGYSPAAIGLSYVLQTIAFLLGGYGCRAALQKWEGQQMLPEAAGAVCLERGATCRRVYSGRRSGGILIPFCVMAVANGAIYLSWSHRRYDARRRQDAPRRCQNTLQLGLCFTASWWCQR